ncbi:hypothetical protein DPX16_14523 [Anabarilius grahami]|uniref:Uncharacterized protein n=1 Tax=Anabarilius grahami TaxID=495550 RepID=A0A3N0YY98_ANAGA|nr:hypothetical protein DPX16_14523 [Anabarilius grahami]
MNTVNVLFLNVPRQIKRFLPTFADTAFRTPLCLFEFGKRSAVPFRSITEPTNPQCSPESRVKTEPTWTNTSPSFPSAGAPAGPQWGTLSQHGDHSGYKGMHMAKARPRSRARSSGNIED